MIEIDGNNKGYVYILEVKDIELPVCKIGMTSRNPYTRCEEINKSSTGDFIWAVSHYVSVDNCKSLESLVHAKLDPLRQKRREFFSLSADDAYKAILSIIAFQTEIRILEDKEAENRLAPIAKANKIITNKPRSRNIDSEYVELLHLFTTLLGVKGRPFGQLNKPGFGISDGNNGVQWNLSVSTDTDVVRVGVNLEGLKYGNWPILRFIKSELEASRLDEVRSRLKSPENVFVQFTRDAWQAASRPRILEAILGGQVSAMAQLDAKQWALTLTEALSCLEYDNDHCGRALQNVTVINKRNESQVKVMQVSPHLRVWMTVATSGDMQDNLQKALTELQPVYDWVKQAT